MKKLVLYTLFFCTSLVGQNKDSIRNSELQSENTRLKALLDSEKEEDLLSRLILDTVFFKVEKETLKVEKVEILISNSLIARTRVIFTNKRVFQTKKIDAVALYKLNEFINEILLYEVEKKLGDSSKTENTIRLSQLITYIDELDKVNYLPKDELITLTPKDRIKDLQVQTDLNSFIDFRIYSDLLALLDKEGNGLVQSEVSSKIIVNSRMSRHLAVLNYLEPTFKLSKFDNKFKSQVVTDTTTKFNIDRLKLNQLAYVELGFRLNILKANILQHTFDIFNIGADFKYSDVLFQSDNTTKTLNTFGTFMETRGQILKYKNFGFEYGLQAYFQKIQDANVEKYERFDTYYTVECSLFYHPNSNPLNLVFVRFKNIQTGNAKGFYSTLQIGYKSRLSLKK